MADPQVAKVPVAIDFSVASRNRPASDRELEESNG